MSLALGIAALVWVTGAVPVWLLVRRVEAAAFLDLSRVDRLVLAVFWPYTLWDIWRDRRAVDRTPSGPAAVGPPPWHRR